MKRIVLVMTVLLALLGCGGGNDGWKAECSETKPCAAGNYCAETPDGNVCWPDDVDPAINSVQATCAGVMTCRRDGTLHVEVVATDDAKMGAVQAELSIDPGHPRTLEHVSGDTYAVDISLTAIAFPHFEQQVDVTVTARDGAGNEVTGDPTSLNVTRLAWTSQLATSASFFLWSPAVLSDGRIVVAGRNGRLHFVSKTGVASPVTVIPNELNGPAAVGPDAIWVGSEDGRLYPVSTGGAVGTSCNAGAAMLGAPAIRGTRAISATKNSFVAVADVSGVCVPTSVATPAQPVVSSAGRVFVPSNGKLRSYSVAANGALVDEWTDTPPAPSVGNVFVPPSIDAEGSVWTTSNPGPVYRTTSSGSSQQVPADPAISDSSSGTIILADGSAVIGEFSTSSLRRLATGTSPSWTGSEALDGHPGIPLVLTGATPGLLVGTDNGWSAFVRQSDGGIDWKWRISTSALQPPNIWTEPGATTSTAYLAGADGYLYAVIVDGHLDTSAPWPKAYHDPQNTSNAGVTP